MEGVGLMGNTSTSHQGVFQICWGGLTAFECILNNEISLSVKVLTKIAGQEHTHPRFHRFRGRYVDVPPTETN